MDVEMLANTSSIYGALWFLYRICSQKLPGKPFLTPCSSITGLVDGAENYGWADKPAFPMEVSSRPIRCIPMFENTRSHTLKSLKELA